MLLCKRISVNPKCSICNSDDESVIHSLVTCSFVKECHQLTLITQVAGDFHNFPDRLQLVFDQNNKQEICNKVTVCWFLWKNRNDVVWKQRGSGASDIVYAALSFLNQWKAAQDNNFNLSLSLITSEDGLEQWCPPPVNSVKVNVDVALFEVPSRHSHAIVVRNHSAQLVQALSKCSFGKTSPELAESLGIREALSWIKNNVVVNVTVESDCLQVIQLVCSSFSSYSYWRVVDECRYLLESLKNQNVVLRFVKRPANNVAYYLARYSCSLAERKWDMWNVHPAFYHMLCKDFQE
ncbi:uncharacterized protein LOC141719891 [Apium graveolens]|uniref:uncharacterized protein LOC141719891 n=1 Tax=Apium graveolens TaxID=4045 RepID=UPI003D7A968D